MKRPASLLLLVTMANCVNAQAEDVKADGQWRGNGGAAWAISSGNTHSSSLNFTADAARVTLDDKLSLYGYVVRSRSKNNGITSTTANQSGAGIRFNHNISANTFGFSGLDFSHDQIKKLSLRSAVSGGLGYHLIKTPETQWDVLGGVAYRVDQYSGLGVSINNEMKTGLNAVELLLGEESSHKLTGSTSFKQKLMISTNLSSSKGTRATFDAGLAVALNQKMSLTITLQDRYDDLAEAPIKKNDILFFTGINVKFGD